MFGWLVTIFISYLTMWNVSSDISTTVREPRELALPLLQSLQRSSALPWRCLKNAQPGASLFDWNSEMMQAIDHLRKAVLKRIYRSTIVLTMFFGIGRNPAWISRRLFPPAARNASLPKWLQCGFHRLSCWDMGRSQMGGPQILVTCLLTSWNHERSMKIIMKNDWFTITSHHLTSPHITFIHFLANFPSFSCFSCYHLLSDPIKSQLSMSKDLSLRAPERRAHPAALPWCRLCSEAKSHTVIEAKKMASRSWNFL
jgi:hypothetical protein